MRFTVPTTAIYSLSGLFEKLGTSLVGNGVISSIYNNASLLFSSTTLAGFNISYGTSVAFSLLESFNAGDTVDFVVNNNGSYYNDSSGIAATIETVGVSEPASLGMLGAGLAALGLMRRRRAA